MKTALLKEEILAQFRTIMGNEVAIRPKREIQHQLHVFEYSGMFPDYREDIYFYNVVWRIFEIIQSSFVPRSYNATYNLSDGDIVYESVAAHTNTVIAIATEALDFYYDGDFGGSKKSDHNRTVNGRLYREIIEAIRLHDLPENITGDLPDNGSRNEAVKRAQESEYLDEYLGTYPSYSKVVRGNTKKVLDEMETQSSETGRLVYLADKVSALLTTLCLDNMNRPPMILKDSPYASERDRREMEICDYACGHYYKASEMWAVDFFVLRKLVRFDDEFFFTALIVMATLIVNGKWYSWREKRYI